MGAVKLAVVGGRANKHEAYGFIPFHEMEIGDVIEIECHPSSVHSFNSRHPETKFSTKGSLELPDGWVRITRIR